MLPLHAWLGSEHVCQLAASLLGKRLVAKAPEGLSTSIIVETEAFAGPLDKASHAWNNRRTARTEVLFGPPGCAYVYRCYGLHWLFNVVAVPVGVPHAVLIRAGFPTHGLEYMQARRPKDPNRPDFETVDLGRFQGRLRRGQIEFRSLLVVNEKMRFGRNAKMPSA